MIAWMLEEGAKAVLTFAAGFFLKKLKGDTTLNEMKCLIEKCTRPASSANKRGLCALCHCSAKKRVDAGEVTWDKLVEMGLCKSDKDPFDDAYSRAMDDRHLFGTEGDK